MRTYNGIGQSILRKCKSGILLNVLLFLGKYVFFWHFKIYVWTLFSEIFSLSWDCRDMKVRYCIFIFSVVLKGSPQNKRCLLKVSKSEMQISKPSSLRVKWDFFWIKSIAWKGLDSNWTSERFWPHCSLVQFDNGQIYQSRQIVLFHPSTCGGSMQQLMYLRAHHLWFIWNYWKHVVKIMIFKVIFQSLNWVKFLWFFLLRRMLGAPKLAQKIS